MAGERGFVARNAAALGRLRAVIGRLSEDELRRRMGEHWTVAAALAHLAFWDRRSLLLLRRWQREGYGPAPLEVDLINDTLLEEWLALAPKEAARLALSAAEAIDRELETVPDALIEQIVADSPNRIERAQHRNSHLDEVERALVG